MLKRLILAGLLSLVTASAFAAGTIPFSLSQQFDSLGKPLANCYFYTIVAGTTSTPQNAYQDSALTLPQANPMRCDASGRLPQFFLADGLIKVRITDKNGVSQAYPNGATGIDNIQVIGPSGGGGGGGGAVDPTTIAATGDIKAAYGTAVLSGWVRANGRTIGSATSGATERANADCQALFVYLWGADANLAVSGGRGASGAADWAANKTIALPDMRGRVLAGLDDMGATAAGIFTGIAFATGNATTLGSTVGTSSQTLAQRQLPNATLSYSNSISVTSTASNVFLSAGLSGIANPGAGTIFVVSGTGATQSSVTSLGNSSGTTSSINGGVTQVALPTIQATTLMTFYQKL